jgi:hypothetical protein
LKLDALINLLHGSLESKPKMIDDFNEAHPECSKNSIEKKIRECFVKDKRGQDPRQRYYATDEFLQQQGFIEGSEKLQELQLLAQKRVQPLIDEIRQAQQELEEKKQHDLAEKERE